MFRPSIIPTPVNCIADVYNDAKRFFPDARMLVYYMTPRTFTVKGANVISRNLLCRLAKNQYTRSAPKMGQTIILTTHPIWYRHNWRRRMDMFVWKDKRDGDPEQQKIRKPG